MSKRLNLEALGSSKSLRLRKSAKKMDNLGSETSQFFVTSSVKQEEGKNLKDFKKPSKSRSKKRSPVKIKCDDLEASENKTSVKIEQDWVPKNWEILLGNIRQMRKNENAPVDELGCHKCADSNVSGPIYRYQSLLALMLSSQTKDQVTHAAMQRLKDFGCTPDSIIAVSNDKLGELIYPVSFWKV